MKIKLFAQLADAIAPEVEVELASEVTRSSILTALMDKYPLQADLIKMSSVAINQTYVYDESFRSEEVQEIAIIPPVSGG
ncbi:MAG: MoaD/ThiS family protein [Streptococcaceae bacterium]|nr:MoaD/ThiS family protein [Streptococcaceae bacterium]